MKHPNLLADQIKGKAKELGFLECVILPADFLAEEEVHFLSWLGAGMQGEMGYMARNVKKRLDPRLLLDQARSVVVVLQNYYPEQTQKDAEAPVLSKYAYGKDYHLVMKEKLKTLLSEIRQIDPSCHGRPFVDSAPVLERAWARRAGLGWVGKNSNLISKKHGSFFFIGELLLDAELPYDQPTLVADHCGTCTRCIDACPTGAIVADRVIDARKCISYQTIELKGPMDEQLKSRFQNRVFGCDICQDVCPWNRKPVPANEPGLAPRGMLLNLSREDWYRIDRDRFNEMFRQSAVKRTGFEGLRRNLEFLK